MNASLVLFGEIIDYKLKTVTNGLISSGLGFGGMFFVLMFLLIKKWYYVFVVSIGLALVTALIIQIWFFDSMKECLLNKNYEKFKKNIKYIAKKNGRLKEFEEAIKTEKYAEILERLRLYTIKSDKMEELGDVKENKSEEKENKSEEKEKKDKQNVEFIIETESHEKFHDKELISPKKESKSPEKNNSIVIKENIETKEFHSQRKLLSLQQNKSEKEKETVAASSRKLPNENINQKKAIKDSGW